jgi:hypothetical protein
MNNESISKTKTTYPTNPFPFKEFSSAAIDTYILYAKNLTVWDLKLLNLIEMSFAYPIYIHDIDDMGEPYQTKLLKSIVKLETLGIITVEENGHIYMSQAFYDKLTNTDMLDYISLPKPHRQRFVYIISYDGKVKIGSTNNIEKRMNALQTASPIKLDLLFCESETALVNERSLHNKFRDFRLIGEFFDHNIAIDRFISEPGGINNG